MNRRKFLKLMGIGVGALALPGLSKKKPEETVTIWKHRDGSVILMKGAEETGYQGRVFDLPLLWNHDPADMISPSDLYWVNKDSRDLMRLQVYFREGNRIFKF